MGLDRLEKYLLGINVIGINKNRISISCFRTVIVLSIIAGLLRYNKQIARFKANSAQFVMFSFFSVIPIGTLMLLQCGHHADHFIVDALFYLCQRDLCHRFDRQRYGHDHRVWAICHSHFIQIGGLGIMTLSSFFTLFFWKRHGTVKSIAWRYKEVDKIVDKLSWYDYFNHGYGRFDW